MRLTLESQDGLRRLFLLIQLRGRYADKDIQQLLNVVTYLNPRYKNLPFLNEDGRQCVHADVELQIINLVETDLSSHVNDKDPQEKPLPKKKKIIGPVSKLLGHLLFLMSLQKLLLTWPEVSSSVMRLKKV